MDLKPKDIMTRQVGQYKSTNTDAATGTKAQILTQRALSGLRERYGDGDGDRQAQAPIH